MVGCLSLSKAPIRGKTFNGIVDVTAVKKPSSLLAVYAVAKRKVADAFGENAG